MSAFSDRIETYRKENNIAEIAIPSVIVQKMVNLKPFLVISPNEMNNIQDYLLYLPSESSMEEWRDLE